MTGKEIIEILKNEMSCVDRAKNCDRDCYNCDLLMPDSKILEAYEAAIKAITDIILIREIIDLPFYIQEDVIKYQIICKLINDELPYKIIPVVGEQE